MSLSLVQKLELSLVYFFINILWFFDNIVAHIKKGLVFVLRVFLCLVLVSSFLKGFYLPEQNIDLSYLSYVFNPVPSDVLGVAMVREDAPYIKKRIPFPDITAKAIYVKDVTKDKELYSKNSTQILAPASTTKLMTALVSLDVYELDEILSIPKICTEIEAQKNGFLEDEKYKVSDLLSSMLINSSADAACALSVGKVSYFDFVERMNKKAKTMGLYSTSFINPIGLDDPNGAQYSTAQDLYSLSIEAVKNPLIKKFVSTTEKTIVSKKGNKSTIINTNQLLWEIPGTVGIKTGKTEAAGEVLIYEYSKDEKDLIIVVMGSADRFADTKSILNWTLESYSWEENP
jgi:D-alanyl-D-alanine carboxypeptidase (penicillin-binding protein 5/6)